MSSWRSGREPWLSCTRTTWTSAGKLLDAVKSVSDVEVQVRETASHEWQIGVCLADRVGTLSLVSGLLTAHGLDIIHADTFTVDHTVSTPSIWQVRSPRRMRRRADGQPVRRRPRRTEFRQTSLPWAVMLFNVRSRSGQAARVGRAEERTSSAPGSNRPQGTSTPLAWK